VSTSSTIIICILLTKKKEKTKHETPEICQPNGNQKDSWESILPTDPLADFFATNN